MPPQIPLVEKMEVGALKHKKATVRYYLALTRFGSAASARANDMQHTRPATMKSTTKTLEFEAWQTKTTSVHEISKKPVPLIAPLHTFSGHKWWETITATIKPVAENGDFKEADFLFPALTSDYNGFIPRPATKNQIVSVVRKGLMDMVNAEEIWGTTESECETRPMKAYEAISKFTMSSMRVFIPEWAYKAGVSREDRRYIGRWKDDTTPDVYTREHRTKILQIMDKLEDKRNLIERTTEVPEDLADEYFWKTDGAGKPQITDVEHQSWQVVMSSAERANDDENHSADDVVSETSEKDGEESEVEDPKNIIREDEEQESYT